MFGIKLKIACDEDECNPEATLDIKETNSCVIRKSLSEAVQKNLARRMDLLQI